MSGSPVLSRRTALAAAGSAIVTCRLARAQDYKPQEQFRVSKAAAHYQDQPRGDESCGSCPYFLLPKGCVTVDGEISPNGWCPMYTRFAPLDRGAHAAGRG